MQNYLVIDFETVDPYISNKYGAGWTFALNNESETFKLVGVGIYDSVWGTTVYYTDFKEAARVLSDCPVWVVFNAQYDVGCILYLFKLVGVEIDLSKVKIIDAMLMAKLYRQDLQSYSLSSLCSIFKLPVSKQEDVLANYVWGTKIFQKRYTELTGRTKRTKPPQSTLYKVAISMLDKLPTSIVAKYCNADVDATNALYLYLKDLVTFDEEMYSDLIKIVVDIRRRGVRVDLKLARQASEDLKAIEDAANKYFLDKLGYELNFNSHQQLSDYLRTLGVTHFPKTEKDNDSVKTEFLESLEYPDCQLIAKARTAKKIRTSFIDKIISYQDVFPQQNTDYGKIYISLHILGADRTGRFSSGPYRSEESSGTSFEISIHQIPARHPELGMICRSIFLPDEGETWVSGDFSSQEQRIQVDLAEKLNCTGAKLIGDGWRVDPLMSFHDKVAALTGLTRSKAKTISLGRSYGMGDGKLCKSLGLPTEEKDIFGRICEVAGAEGKKIIEQYNKMLPFIVEVQKRVNEFFTENGYLKTIGKRKLKLSTQYSQMDGRKGFSKYVQGSAADQTMIAMVLATKAGLKIINQVHDEINISSNNPERDSKILKECMETAIKLTVPVIADIGTGDNWYKAKP